MLHQVQLVMMNSLGCIIGHELFDVPDGVDDDVAYEQPRHTLVEWAKIAEPGDTFTFKHFGY